MRTVNRLTRRSNKMGVENWGAGVLLRYNAVPKQPTTDNNVENMIRDA